MQTKTDKSRGKTQELDQAHRLKLPEWPEDSATDRPTVEDLPQGKAAAKEAARPQDD